MLNEVVIMGNLTKDVYFKESNGTTFAGITLAVNGYKENDVSYVNVCIFGNTAKAVKQYCKKGQKVVVVGYLHTRKSNDLFITEIIANKVEFIGAAKKDEKKEEDPAPFDIPSV